MNKIHLEYLFLDGNYPQQIRSKTKIIDFPKKIENIEQYYEKVKKDINILPVWSFDGSSTGQAETSRSELLLKPVNVFIDPFKNNGLMVLCEVYNTDMTPHITNTRHILNNTINKFKLEWDNIMIGSEQEYFLYDNITKRPVGWPSDKESYPERQGNYYCGVGTNNVRGRDFVNEHSMLCEDIGLGISGTNAEVCLGQWEYQISGYGIDCADQIWISRYLLQRHAESYNYYINFDPKPFQGRNWNGSGMHFNFSTKEMRKDLKNKLELVTEACKKLSIRHKEHIKVYGPNNYLRLTGENETCSINQFRYGIGDRTASIRIPSSILDKTTPGYFEDRRPASNCDPYEVVNILIETIFSKTIKKKYGEDLEIMEISK